MSENLLPHDMDEILGSNKSNYQKPNYTPSNHTPSNYTPSNYTPSNHTPSNYTPSNYTPSNHTPSNHTPSNYMSSNHTPNHINYKANTSIIEEKITKPQDIKKKNVFTKISNNISNRPKCYLILIIILIIIILILLIYYKGLLFIGPYCTNNIKSNAYKNRMNNKSQEQTHTSLKESLKN
jgi:hypothetical protein